MKIKVLFVEDDKVDQMALKRMIKEQNLDYDYMIAGSMFDAKQILDTEKFDIAVIDYVLGDGTALDIMDSLMSTCTPSIIMTGAGDEIIAVKVLKAGAYDYLIKDNDLNCLKALPNVIEHAIKQRKTEEQLQKTIKELRDVKEALDQHSIVAITDAAGKITYTNSKFCEVSKYSPEELLGSDHRMVNSKHHSSEFMKKLWDTVSSGKVWKGEVLDKAKDGTFFWMDTTIMPFLDDQGNPYQYVAVRADITKRKHMEEELRSFNKSLEQRIAVRTAELAKVNEKLVIEVKEHKQAEVELRRSGKFLQSIFDGIQDGISILDKELNIIRVNQTMEKWYSHALPLIGKKCYQVYHGESGPCTVCPTIRALGKGTLQMDIVPLVGAKGQKGWLELYAFPLKDDNDNIKGAIEYVRDITERKLAEEQIKTSLNEKEILLMEVHHRVKNNMQVISSLLRLKAGSLEDKNIINILEECQNRIKAMVMIHEKLYQSKDFTNINFGEYIKNLANTLFRSYKMSVARIALNINVSDITIDIDSVVPCGLIVNELITNSLKYAFPDDKKGEIKISLHKNEKSEITLIFSDNGIGIPEDLNYRNTKSLGLRLIFNMTEHQLDGKVELDRSNGTEFRISFVDVSYKKRI